MEQNNPQTLALSQVLSPEVAAMQSQFAMAVQCAQDVKITDNACAAFETVAVLHNLRAALTDDVVKQVFEPLMNTRIGFKTDKVPGKKKFNKDSKQEEISNEVYDTKTVKDCIIDAICIGLLPTGNQFNIIAGQMYPTKEGYTALLKRIGCKYVVSVGQDQRPSDSPFAEIPCKINFEWNNEKSGYTFIATVKKDSHSSMDQLRGKAERRAKKSLFEYLTGCDFGDADEDSSQPIQAAPNAGPEISMPKKPTAQQTMNNAGANAENSWKQAKKQAEAAQEQPIF